MSRLLIALGLLGLPALAAACASTARTPQESGVACELSASDSLFLRAGPVYRECSVSRPARLIDRPLVAGPTPIPVCHKATLEFVVGADGRIEVETARVTNTDNDNITAAIAKTLPDWRFHPARRGEEPVRQIVRVEQVSGTNGMPFTVGRVGGAPVPAPPRSTTTASLDCG